MFKNQLKAVLLPFLQFVIFLDWHCRKTIVNGCTITTKNSPYKEGAYQHHNKEKCSGSFLLFKRTGAHESASGKTLQKPRFLDALRYFITLTLTISFG